MKIRGRARNPDDHEQPFHTPEPQPKDRFTTKIAKSTKGTVGLRAKREKNLFLAFVRFVVRSYLPSRSATYESAAKNLRKLENT